MIVGDLPQFTAVSIGWHDDVDVAREAIDRAVEAGRTPRRRVLLLTDMFGGTPSNLGLTFLEAGRVEVDHGRQPADADQARQVRRGTMDLRAIGARTVRARPGRDPRGVGSASGGSRAQPEAYT